MLKTIREIIACLRHRSYQGSYRDCFLKNREISLLLAGISGLILAPIIYCLVSWITKNTINPILQSSLTVLALGIPTFFILWIFRTHDVQRQIDKAQEQIDKAQEQIDKTQESINNSFFFECAKMLTVDCSSAEKTVIGKVVLALEQLAYLRRETEFDKDKIDFLTRGISFRGIGTRQNLSYARLEGINLSGAKLIGVDLSYTNLKGADLRGADLRAANLTAADLLGANLREAIYDDDTNFAETYLQDKGVRDQAGMIYQPVQIS